MTAIGEVKNGKEIGKRSTNKFMWYPCSVCGVERWVRIIKDKVENDKCTSCGKVGKRIRPNLDTSYTPQLGEIRHGDEIGYKYHKQRYIWEKCNNCGIPRWCQYPSKIKFNKCRKCLNKGRIGERNGMWKGGTKINHAGYKLVILRPDNPYYEMASPAGYVFEHRLIAAQQLGRCLHDWEMVHHRDSNKQNNDPSNLFVTDASNHNTLVEYVLKLQELELKEQKSEIKDLKSRVTLLEAENTLYKMDMSEFV